MIKSYIVKHKSNKVRLQSRSGGAFTLISDWFIENGGIVYGCITGDDFLPYHTRADNATTRDKMRGSKYVQSNLGVVFKEIKNDLINNKYVLFTGTACQVDGLLSYLNTQNIPTNNLFLVDIICHGVASPQIWLDYLSLLAKKKRGKIEAIDFRNKKFGWTTHFETITIDGKEYKSNAFKNLFFGKNILRPSCYNCPYKSTNRISDITIGDAWGVNNSNTDFFDELGVSLVLCNTDKGVKLFNQFNIKAYFKECDINNYLQPALLSNFSSPQKRNEFWKKYKTKGINYIVRWYSETNKLIVYLHKIKSKVCRALRRYEHEK